ncbi:MAG: DNA primase, partial [Colwellia sp.]
GNEKRLEELRKKNIQNNKANAAKRQSKITPLRLAIALLLEHPHIISALPDITILQQLDMPGIPLLNSLLVLCKQNSNINSAQLIEHFRGTTEGNQLTKLMCLQHHVEPENAESMFIDVIESFLNIFIEQRTEQLLAKEHKSGLSKSEKQELHSLLSA